MQERKLHAEFGRKINNAIDGSMQNGKSCCNQKWSDNNSQQSFNQQKLELKTKMKIFIV